MENVKKKPNKYKIILEEFEKETEISLSVKEYQEIIEENGLKEILEFIQESKNPDYRITLTY